MWCTKMSNILPEGAFTRNEIQPVTEIRADKYLELGNKISVQVGLRPV